MSLAILTRLLACLALVLPAAAGPLQGPWEPIDSTAEEPPGSTSTEKPANFGTRGGALRLDIVGELDTGLASQLRRARQLAAAQGDVLVIVLDTPGGEVGLMRRLARQISEADGDGVKTVAWVADRAHSAGALLALACREIYTTPRGTIGSATPILVPGAFSVALPEAVDEKFNSAMRAEFRATAEARGRPGRIAEAMVDADVEVWELVEDGRTQYLGDSEYDDRLVAGLKPGVARRISPRGELLNLTAGEARRVGITVGIAADLPELMAKLGLAGVEPVVVQRTAAEDAAVWLDQLAVLLLLAGLLLAYAELKVPGFGVPGIASIICFALFFGGRWLVGLADWPQLILIVAGLALLAAEVFVLGGTLWVGLLGGVLLFGGLLWSQLGPGLDLARPMDQELLMDELIQLLLTGLAALVGLWILGRILPRTPLLSRLVLVPAGAGAGGGSAAGLSTAASALPVTDLAGQADHALVGSSGIVHTDLRPVGRVELEGRGLLEFEARSTGPFVERGARVRVVDTDGGRLIVEPITPSTEDPA